MQNKMNLFIFYAEVLASSSSSAKIDNLSQKKIINSHVLFNQTKEYTHSRTFRLINSLFDVYLRNIRRFALNSFKYFYPWKS